jgi:hypothetical protein
MRTFQEHQNAMLKSLRDHVQSLHTKNANLVDDLSIMQKDLNLANDCLALILMKASDPTIEDIQVLRNVINYEITNYLDTSKRQG